jgi:hypothetical protein
MGRTDLATPIAFGEIEECVTSVTHKKHMYTERRRDHKPQSKKINNIVRLSKNSQKSKSVTDVPQSNDSGRMRGSHSHYLT